MNNIYTLQEGNTVFCHRKNTGYGRIQDFDGDVITIMLRTGKIIYANTQELSRVPNGPKFTLSNLPPKHRAYAQNERLQEQIRLGARFVASNKKTINDPLYLKGLQQTDFILPSWKGKKPNFEGRAKSLWAKKSYRDN